MKTFLLIMLSMTLYQTETPRTSLDVLLDQILSAQNACMLGEDITDLYPGLDSKDAWYLWNNVNWPYRRPARLYFVDGAFQLRGRDVDEAHRVLAQQLPESRRDFWLIYDEEIDQWIYLEFVSRVFRDFDGQGDHCHCIRVLDPDALRDSEYSN